MEEIPAWLRDWEGDGIIARVQDEATARMFEKVERPVVDVLGVVRNSRLPVVHVDDEKIGKMAASFLASAGLRNFGFFGIVGENWSEIRREGFAAEIRSRRLRCDVLEVTRQQEGDSLEFRRAISAWLQTLPTPVGIMVSSDQRALHVLETCRELDLPVPEMASIISVDNDQCLCELSTPTLTSIRAGHFRAGYEAAKLLDRMLSGEEVPAGLRQLVPASGIIERGSTDSPVVSDQAVARGLRHIREHLASSLTNEQIARAAGISRTLFQRKFQEATGKTVQEFVLQSRLRKVERLMRHEQLSLAQIAELCGFRHQQYLGHVIKRHLGKTPASWRGELLEV